MSFGPPYLDRRKQPLNIGDVVVMVQYPGKGQLGAIIDMSPDTGVRLVPGVRTPSIWRHPHNVELHISEDLQMDLGL